MPIKQWIFSNYYRDSVALMQLSDKLQALEGISQASAIMASATNIALLVDSGLLAEAIPPQPNDLLVVIEGRDVDAIQKAHERAEDLLTRTEQGETSPGEAVIPPQSIQMGVQQENAINLALISTPGAYAAAEALKAMHLGLHVMMFSDNVDQAHERMLKQYSADHDLLFMGPDCGTAIINGIPLGFANVVQRGSIGVVAASGTGLQQVTCLIDRWGGGISQAIGTGGHDLSASVGGVTMQQGIRALAADPHTEVIVLVSKPPAPEVMERVIAQAQQAGKPVVVQFIGADHTRFQQPGLFGAPTLAAAARVAVSLAKKEAVVVPEVTLSANYLELARNVRQGFATGQQFIRGLFSGGTFCFEALHLLGQKLGAVYSNIPINPAWRLPDVWQSQGHTAIDLGDDLFTQGRPHPMIDFRLRNERLLQEARDPQTAVILLDIVLGYGSHADPASEIIPAIHQAQTLAEQAGRQLVFVASVCGTERDPQQLRYQETALRDAGVLLTESNAEAALLAGAIVTDMKGAAHD